MINIYNYLLRIFVRSNLISSFIYAILMVLLFSIFMSNISVVEESEILIVIFAGIARYVSVFLMICFVCNNMFYMYEARQIDFILTKSINRKDFAMAYSFVLVTFNLLIVIVICLLLLLFSSNYLGVLLFSLSLYLELITVTIFAFSASLITKKYLSSIIYSTCFYILSRSAGIILMIATNDKDNFSLDLLYKWLPQKIITLINLIIPRFDIITQTDWLLYVNIDSYMYNTVYYAFLGILLFSILLILSASYDLKKQEF
jgi:hypothetical protein